MTRAGWWKEVSLAALLFSAAFLLTWMLGSDWPLLAAAAGLITYWLTQLRRVANWLRHPDREPPEASGIWGDIFDGIYRLQREDREERDRLQTAVSYLRDSFAALKDSVVLIDPSGNIEWSNSAAETMMGLQYPRDRGQALLNLIRLPEFHAYFSGQDYGEPLRMDGVRHDEDRLLVEITPFGKGSRLMFVEDVTREERMQDIRRDFVANVSHELRTPLTVIMGYLLTLMDSGLAEDKVLGRPLKHMHQNAQRMENLLRDLLWLSRLESVNPATESFAELSVSDLLREVRDEALGLYPDREIALDLDETLKITGNYQYIHSAFSNLVTNAMKYSEGVVELCSTQDGEKICIAVTDHGAGIDALHLPRLTERFYRVDRSRSQATGGTGLGLAIVKHVLASHDALLEIESTPGVGSSFRCIFPV